MIKVPKTALGVSHAGIIQGRANLFGCIGRFDKDLQHLDLRLNPGYVSLTLRALLPLLFNKRV